MTDTRIERPAGPDADLQDIFALYAPKGGSGRTTMALNLAAQQTIAQHPHPGYFSAGPSFLIVAAYAAAAIAAAAFMITRRYA